MIFGRPWMKKHEVLLEMIYDSITFSPGFYMHLGIFLSLISPKLIEKTKEISKTKQ